MGRGGRLSSGVQFSVSREAGKQQAMDGTSMEWLRAGMSGVRARQEPTECPDTAGTGRGQSGRLGLHM